MLKNQDKMGNRKIPGITSLLNIVGRYIGTTYLYMFYSYQKGCMKIKVFG